MQNSAKLTKDATFLMKLGRKSRMIFIENSLQLDNHHHHSNSIGMEWKKKVQFAAKVNHFCVIVR